MTRTTLKTLAMTAVETAALVWYIVYIHDAMGQGGVYSHDAVYAGGVLLVGLFIEQLIANVGDERFLRADAIARFGTIAAIEVVVWSQWANLITLGMWSRRGIGPAFVVVFLLLVAVHVTETAWMGDGVLQIRHGATAFAEALAATTGWVLVVEGAPLEATLAVFALILVEHATRMFDLDGSAADGYVAT